MQAIHSTYAKDMGSKVICFLNIVLLLLSVGCGSEVQKVTKKEPTPPKSLGAVDEKVENDIEEYFHTNFNNDSFKDGQHYSRFVIVMPEAWRNFVLVVQHSTALSNVRFKPKTPYLIVVPRRKAQLGKYRVEAEKEFWIEDTWIKQIQEGSAHTLIYENSTDLHSERDAQP